MERISFETHPSNYKHWKLSVDGEIARLTMSVDDDHALKPGYELKLNSYDLAVDIELSDAISRLRFEHPEVRSVVISADIDRVFCSGANIYMLGALVAQLQGELLQVHQRNSPLHRGCLSKQRSPFHRRVQRRHRGRRIRAGPGVRRNHPRR